MLDCNFDIKINTSYERVKKHPIPRSILPGLGGTTQTKELKLPKRLSHVVFINKKNSDRSSEEIV